MPADESRGEPAENTTPLRRLLKTPIVYWALGALVLITAVFALVRLPGAEAPDFEWLYAGREFPVETAERIAALLKNGAIPCQQAGGRIGVPPGRKAEALALLVKNRLAPRSLEELLEEEPSAGALFETPEQRKSRERRADAHSAAKLISGVPGVTRAVVLFTPEQVGTPLHPQTRVKTTAFIETAGNRLLPPERVQMIRNILVAFPNVSVEGVTVLDPSSNHEYLIAGQPQVESRSNLLAHEEALRGRILADLDIEGAQVAVRLEPAQGSGPMTGALVNQPIGDASMDEVDPQQPDASEVRINKADGPVGRERATVLVRVPRSHFLQLFQDEHPGKSPSPEAMMPLAVRVRDRIREVVRAHLPHEALADLRIDRLEEAAAPAEPQPAKAQARSSVVPSWVPVGGGIALALVVLVALCGGWLAARRPADATGAPASGDSFATASRALSRARAFIERDEAAAARVLRTWIAQGGHAR